MVWIDRVEKLSRVILWLSIASACVLAPITYMRNRRTEAEERDAARRADEAAKAAVERADKAAHEPHRLAIASMGVYMSSLVPGAPGGQGNIWFTNVSSRTGFLCVYGVATNRGTKQTSRSIAACADVHAYASTEHLSLMFAGGELSGVCPKQGDCDLAFVDAPEAKEIPPASP
jgi:hypothetical protein